MLNIDKIPMEKIDDELREQMEGVDDALGGSEWMQVFAQTPALYKDFVKWYYTHISSETDGISAKLTELVRLRVAQVNQCPM
jgi:alkylhydroperoxidase family enzyme